ncbi:hypothetical protein IW261DRAFT_1633006 [Armillaria novae-zelandiae]|uniref:Uncharacterized protein n=1 Tax=Armillaria novae-zelandiae TaxID=153914 RepID=A0AA39P4S8_9AGAR|nr:hypothetical protein IW261DRAFT_1633006 [Armillaria novae-zelandiae]
MAPLTNFSTYQSPSPTAKFSEGFFEDLKFKSISELGYPFIAPQKSISGFTWSMEIPVTASAMLILLNDIIPDLSDITMIVQQLPAVYEQGYHTVDISFCIEGTTMIRMFHFLKLHLCMSINNHQEAISLTKSLVHSIDADQLLESSHDYCMFMESKIFFFVQGFHSTCVWLWELGHLLDEKWIKEDVLNLACELLYFCLALPSKDPSFLFLPTSFFMDACWCYAQSPPFYSPKLLAFHHQLTTTCVQAYGFIIWDQDHFSGYFRRQPGILEHGDSLHHLPAPDVEEVLNWSVALQGVPNWDPSLSHTFRHAILQDLLIYHNISQCQNFSFFDCVEPCNEDCEELAIGTIGGSPGVTGYNEFNVYKPMEIHPIFEFLDRNVSGLHLAQLPTTMDLRWGDVLAAPLPPNLPLQPKSLITPS